MKAMAQQNTQGSQLPETHAKEPGMLSAFIY